MTKDENNIMEDEKNLTEVENENPEVLQKEEEDDPIFRSKALLEEKENEILDLSNKLARLQADFQNYKRRAEKDMEQSITYGIESIMLDLLPVVDNFQRAIQAHENKEDGFFNGISMIEKQIIQVMEKNKVSEIESLGKVFDPNLHHAVSVLENEAESGMVIEVLQKGYMLKDKVIRPSMVVVAK